MAEIEKEVEATESKSEAPKKSKKTSESQEKKGFFARVGGFFARLGPRLKKMWRDYTSEMKKVVWMPWKDVKKSTLLVCVTVVIIGVAIGVVDFVFSEVIGGIAGFVG